MAPRFHALDDRDTVEKMRATRRRWRAVIDDADASETEREEARGELEEIGAWARKHVRGTEGNEQRQVWGFGRRSGGCWKKVAHEPRPGAGAVRGARGAVLVATVWPC